MLLLATHSTEAFGFTAEVSSLASRGCGRVLCVLAWITAEAMCLYCGQLGVGLLRP